MRRYFYGWYIKCQSDKKTLAVIMASHLSKEGRSASVQVITDDGAYCFDYPFTDWSGDEKAFSFRIGENRLDEQGMRLRLSQDGNVIGGDLRFGSFTPLAYDIMGPFLRERPRLLRIRIPGIERRHDPLIRENTIPNGAGAIPLLFYAMTPPRCVIYTKILLFFVANAN